MSKVRLIVLNLKDRPGTVAHAIGALGQAGVNLKSIFGWGPDGLVQLTVDDFRKATKALQASGIEFSEAKAEVVELRDEPGSLHAYLAKLAKKGVNLRSIARPQTDGPWFGRLRSDAAEKKCQRATQVMDEGYA